MTGRTSSRRSPSFVDEGALGVDKGAFWYHNSLHEDDDDEHDDDMSEKQVPLGLHSSGLTSLHENEEVTFEDGEEQLISSNDSTHTYLIGDAKIVEERDKEKDDAWLEFPLDHDISFPMLSVGAESVRRRLLASIERLSTHVPEVVLYRLLDEAQAQTSYASFGLDGSYDDDMEDDDDDDSCDSSSKSTISELSDIDDTLAAYMKKMQPPPVVTKKKKKVARSLIGGSFEMKAPDFRHVETGSRARSICSGIFPLSESGVVSTGSSLCGLRSLTSGMIPTYAETYEDDSYDRMYYAYQQEGTPSAHTPQHTPHLMSFLSRQVLSLKRSRHRTSVKKRLFGEGEGGLQISAEQQKYRDLSLKAFGLGDQPPPSPTAAATTPPPEMKDTVDPFPYDSDDERLVKERFSTERHQLWVEKGRILLYPEDISTPLKTNVQASSKAMVGTIEGTPYNGGLPFVARRNSAILVIGISGFTKLSTVLALENLADAIRDSSFDLIVDDIKAHGGDILKFAGDAILVEWSTLRSSPVPVDATHSFVPSSLGECALAAATCAAKLVSEYSNVHCALGVGEIVGIHLGASRSRRKHIVLGYPLDQASEASRRAKLGEVISSPEAVGVLSTVCDFDQGVDPTTSDRPQVIANGKIAFWGNIQAELKSTDTICEDNLKKIIRKLRLKSLQRYRELIMLYTHPVVAEDDEVIFNDRTAHVGAQGRVGETGEIRSVYTFYIALLLPVRVSDGAEKDQQLFVLLNDVMNLTTSELFKCGGHLRQFIADDKGVVIMATLGLRGSARRTAAVALPAAISIQNVLKNELGIQSQIGATLGEAYCGVVGGMGRREYTVLGPLVNLASRLMSFSENPGILVCQEVQAKANKAYAFNALEPMKAKGIVEMVPIFEPLGSLERTFGRLLPNFVGRHTEIGDIVDAAKALSKGDGKARIFVLYGNPGMGKSSTSVHALEHIYKAMETNHGQLFLSKTRCSETDKLVPFGTFSKLLVEVLDFRHGSIARRSTRRSVNALDPLDVDIFSRVDEKSGSVLSKQANRLAMIGREMHAPPEFFELICGQLLGIGLFDETRTERGNWSIESHTNLIDFLVCAFLRCVENCKLSVLLLDDVDNMDELSSLIFQELFKRAPYLLIICTSSAPSPDKDHFWNELLGDCQSTSRFEAKRLIPFTDEEVSMLISTTLGLQLADGVPALTRTIILQSQGIPQVACAIVESMKHAVTDSMVRALGLSGDDESPPVRSEELFADRMQSLDVSVQVALGIGAVYGSTFELSDIVSFLQQSNETDDDMRTELLQMIASLELAFEEDILYISEDAFEEGQHLQSNPHRSLASQLFDSTDKSNEEPRICIRFEFCNPIWRSTAIEMLPDSKRREVHKCIASSIQSRRAADVHDFVSEAKMFMHWQAGGNKEQATRVALSLAESYERVGLHSMRILPIEDALCMWDGDDDTDDDIDDDVSSNDTVASMTQENLDALTVVDVKCQIQLFVAAGEALTSDNFIRESVVAYQNALMIISDAKAANDLDDFSIVFPVFDALLLAIDVGHIGQDDESSFELALLARFVHISFLHGDPIHRARALALQAQVKARLGKFQKAIAVQQVLSQVYQAGEHSAGMIKLYGSDVAAQCLGRSALWYVEVKDTDAALAMCNYVATEIMPSIGVRDAQTCMMILYPLLWVLKDNGLILDAKELFAKHVMDSTRGSALESSVAARVPIFEAIMMLLNLSAGTVTENDRRVYTEWALFEGNLQFGSELNSLMGQAGRCPDTISSEICLLLATNSANEEEKSKLTLVGLAIAMETALLTEEEGMIVAGSQAKPVYERLVAMASIQDNISPDPIQAGDHNLIFI